jgi:chromosome segregation ATPase
MSPTKSELEDQIAKLTSSLDALRVANATKDQKLAEQQDQISTLKHQREELISLKPAAAQAGVSYEVARRWCEGNIVASARKVGGRWFVNPADLSSIARLRAAPTDFQKRSIF